MRLFVALNFSDAVRNQVFRAAQPLRVKTSEARWSRPENLHLTVRFLGELAAGAEKDVARALEGAVAGVSRIGIRFAHFGAFPSPSRPRVIWLGVEMTPALRLLSEQVDAQLALVGFPPDAGSFRPHVTLGRVKDRSATLGRDLLAGAARPELRTDVCVLTADLVRSHLTRAGPRYEILHRAALGSTAKGKGRLDPL